VAPPGFAVRVGEAVRLTVMVGGIVDVRRVERHVTVSARDAVATSTA
jgi:hypothetical protein